jgi:phosphate transport system permease protein
VQEKFGGLVMIYGTLMTSFIALLIAVPVSFGIALFLTEMSPGWLKRPLGIAIELLAAVPSIVYGMWGLLVFGPILATYVQQPLQSCSGVPVLETCSRARRWASASCRPASSWRSWSSLHRGGDA